MAAPRFFVSILLLTACGSGPVHAEIFKWVDESGEVHFSDSKPNDTTPTETLTPPATGGQAERPHWRAQEFALDEAREEEDEASAAKAEAANEAADKAEKCAQAQKRLESLKRPRINQVAEDGTRTRMPEDWRQAQLQEARKSVDGWCS